MSDFESFSLPSGNSTQENYPCAECRESPPGSRLSLKSLAIAGTRQSDIESDGEFRTMSREIEQQILLPDRSLKTEKMDLPGGISGPTMLEALDGDSSWTDVRTPPGVNMIVRNDGPGGEPARVKRFKPIWRGESCC